MHNLPANTRSASPLLDAALPPGAPAPGFAAALAEPDPLGFVLARFRAALATDVREQVPADCAECMVERVCAALDPTFRSAATFEDKVAVMVIAAETVRAVFAGADAWAHAHTRSS